MAVVAGCWPAFSRSRDVGFVPQQTGKIETARSGGFLLSMDLMQATSSFLSPRRALSAPAVATINHLLAQEAWARDALMRHANKVARIAWKLMATGESYDAARLNAATAVAA